MHSHSWDYWRERFDSPASRESEQFASYEQEHPVDDEHPTEEVFIEPSQEVRLVQLDHCASEVVILSAAIEVGSIALQFLGVDHGKAAANTNTIPLITAVGGLIYKTWYRIRH